MTVPPAREGGAARRTLPLGIQSFGPIRQDGHYYVDKTPHLERLIRQGSRYFLSRPRRFGKSLLIDTLAELFRGSEELFRGLAIQDRWDWSVRHPVVRLDFAGGDFSTTDRLRATVSDRMAAACERAGVTVKQRHASDRLATLIQSLHESTGHRVVVLVDEYDKPIVDNLESPDVARANRDFLSGLYGTFKACDAHIRFLMLTGVTKFSKVNLFSGLNNLTDITLDPGFATLCGYTQEELETVFAPELDAPGLEPLDLERIREWYDGYRWLGEPVYNPYDVLLLLRNRRFRPYWFETGSPRFLVELLARRGVASFELDGMAAGEPLLSAFDVERIGTEALLWQTGYLTIVGERERRGRSVYRLGFPNREVRESLQLALLDQMTDSRAPEPGGSGRFLDEMMAEGDLAGVESELRALFEAIPHEWHARSGIARYEGYYASVLFSYMEASGMDVRAEESSAAGRADIVAVLEDATWVFELKIDERASEGAALAQLRERGYAEKHRRRGRKVRLVGIHFSEASRTVTAFEVAEG